MKKNERPLMFSIKYEKPVEGNASPGLEMIEKTSGIDIALQMILFLEQQVKQ